MTSTLKENRFSTTWRMLLLGALPFAASACSNTDAAAAARPYPRCPKATSAGAVSGDLVADFDDPTQFQRNMMPIGTKFDTLGGCFQDTSSSYGYCDVDIAGNPL